MKMMRLKTLEALLSMPEWKYNKGCLTGHTYEWFLDTQKVIDRVVPYRTTGNSSLPYSADYSLLHLDMIEEIWEEL